MLKDAGFIYTADLQGEPFWPAARSGLCGRCGAAAQAPGARGAGAVTAPRSPQTHLHFHANARIIF